MKICNYHLPLWSWAVCCWWWYHHSITIPPSNWYPAEAARKKGTNCHHHGGGRFFRKAVNYDFHRTFKDTACAWTVLPSSMMSKVCLSVSTADIIISSWFLCSFSRVFLAETYSSFFVVTDDPFVVVGNGNPLRERVRKSRHVRRGVQIPSVRHTWEQDELMLAGDELDWLIASGNGEIFRDRAKVVNELTFYGSCS